MLTVEELIEELLKVENKKLKLKLDGTFSVSGIEVKENYVNII